MPAAEIIGLGTWVPPNVLTNADLETLVDTNDQWITERTGIKERRIAGRNESAAAMGRRAAERALASAGLTADDIQLIVVATSTPDHPVPSTACMLQEELGLSRAVGLDVVAACAGFLYALTTASQFIMTGAYETALVVGTELVSRIIDYTDRSTAILFGDGAGAVVLRRGEQGIRAFDMGSDGTRARLLMTPAGGTQWPASAQSVTQHGHYMRMEGREVFKGAVTEMAASSRSAIARSGLTIDDIALVVPHQANQRIIEATARRLGVPMDRVMSDIARYGNTSAASIPIALAEAWEQGRIVPGQHLLLTTFGAGLAWASVVLDWTLPTPEVRDEEPTTSALPIVRALIDGSMWEGQTVAATRTRPVCA